MKDNISDRMIELMEPIDRQIMMCDNPNDLLALASIMLTTSMRMYSAVIGAESMKTLVKEYLDEL